MASYGGAIYTGSVGTALIIISNCQFSNNSASYASDVSKLSRISILLDKNYFFKLNSNTFGTYPTKLRLQIYSFDQGLLYLPKQTPIKILTDSNTVFSKFC